MMMKKSPDKQVRFGVRLSPGEAVQLEAMARHLGISKSDVLRLSLSSQNSLKPSKSDTSNAVVSEALDAVASRIKALDDRLQGMESLLSGAVDLLLSLSRTSQQNTSSTPRHPEPPQGEKTQVVQPASAGPKWSEYVKKNYKTNPVMSDAAWAEFLKTRYTEQHGFPPDLST
jgi:hypothetical protein